MSKRLLSKLFFSLLTLFCCQIQAQEIPNGNFSEWYIGAFDRLANWGTSDGCLIGDASIAFDHVQMESLDNAENLAVKLKTRTEQSTMGVSSYIFLGATGFRGDGKIFDENCDLRFSNTGIPFTEKPTQLNGVYKFENPNPDLNDFGYGIVILKKYDANFDFTETIGMGEILLDPTEDLTQFHPFTINIDYLVEDKNPDTLAIAFYSSETGVPETVLWIDELTFGISNNVSDHANKVQLDLYPNPAKSVLNIQFQDQSYQDFNQVRLINSQGQLVHRQNIISQRTKVLVKDYPAGAYFVSLSGPKGARISKRIMIQ